MGLLDNILSAIDNKKRTLKRGVMDMLDNPSDWSNMTAARMKENLYGGPENWDAMKRYYQQQPYDQKLKDSAQQSMINNAVNESLGAIFVGKGAKTWDKMKEADALARLAKGEDAATVWKETGIAVAPWDNAARTEISDHTAKLTPISELVKQRNVELKAQRDKIVATVKEEGRKPTDLEKANVNQLNELIGTSAYRGTVGDALDHPELFAAHPEMKGQNFRWRELPSGESGSWDQNSGMMLNQGLFGNNAKSIVLHEGQHGSQDYSKLAKGGSPEGMYASRGTISGNVLSPEAQYIFDQAAKEGATPSVEGAAMEAYRRLGGEAESRLTQYRMNLTPEARAALYPYDPAYFKQATGVDIDKLITRGLLDDGPAMSVAPKLTEFEQRHLTAQKNAALPVEQGGLGLPEGNTAMDRARAMGAVDAYHGTASDVTQIDKSMLGSATGAQSAKDAFWLTSSPSTAEGYAHYAANSAPVRSIIQQADVMERLAQRSKNPETYWNKYDDLVRQADEMEASVRDNPLRGQNVMPLMVMDGKKIVKDAKGSEFVDMEGGVNNILKDARRGKKDFVELQNLADDVGFNGRPASHFGVLNPSVVRSRFAAFDPKRRHEADLLGYADPYLLGAMGAGGLLGMGGYSMMNDK
jgi:hypothetical protein